MNDTYTVLTNFSKLQDPKHPVSGVVQAIRGERVDVVVRSMSTVLRGVKTVGSAVAVGQPVSLVWENGLPVAHIKGGTYSPTQVSAVAQGPAGPKGETGDPGANGGDGAPGAAGPAGPAGPTNWRNGHGVPSDALGVDDDYYLDDDTGAIYQKVAGAYVNVANISPWSGTISFVHNEVPTGVVDGANQLFTFGLYVAGSLQLYRNGQRLTPGADYTETSPAAGTATFVTAPAVGSVLLGSYEHAVSTAGNADTLDGQHAAAFAPASLQTGWIADPHTWTNVSADAPIFVFSANYDATQVIGLGDRVQYVQAGVTKYGIVVAMGAFSGGATLITIYGGTDYVMANAAISSPCYSHMKTPFGFPPSPAKWTVSVTNTSNVATATPTSTTWINVGASPISIVIPIGLWRVYYQTINELTITLGAAVIGALRTTLSTANNSESDNSLSSSQGLTLPAITGGLVRFNQVLTNKLLSLAAKANYYLNSFYGFGGVTATSINFRGDLAPTTIRLECAYL